MKSIIFLQQIGHWEESVAPLERGVELKPHARAKLELHDRKPPREAGA
jgi:hypothetical protein